MAFPRISSIFVLLFVAISCEKWFVKNGPEVCIVLEANITGVLKYVKAGENKTSDYSFNITKSNADGKCHDVYKNKSSQWIEISFSPNNVKINKSEEWKLRMWFSSKADKTFTLQDFMLYTYFFHSLGAEKENETYMKNPDSETEVSAEEMNGFKCSSAVLGFMNGTTVQMQNMKVIAFTNLNGTEFPADQLFEQCALDARTSTIVPIVVGACLAGLVVVVLIAYLIGRARAKRQGYASV